MNEVTINDNNALAGLTGLVTFKPGEERTGAGVAVESGIFADDFIIPKVYLQQATGEKYEDVSPGNFVNTSTGQNMGSSFRFIVVDTFKMWRSFIPKTEASKEEYLSSDIFTLDNANDAWEGQTADGRVYKRRQGLYATILLVDDIKAGNSTPMIVDFWKTSKQAGKELITFIRELNSKDAPSSAVVFEMTNDKEKFEKGSAFVKRMRPVVATPAEAVVIATKVYKELKRNEGQIQYDDRDAIVVEAPQAPVQNNFGPVEKLTAENAVDW